MKFAFKVVIAMLICIIFTAAMYLYEGKFSLSTNDGIKVAMISSPAYTYIIEDKI